MAPLERMDPRRRSEGQRGRGDYGSLPQSHVSHGDGENIPTMHGNDEMRSRERRGEYPNDGWEPRDGSPFGPKEQKPDLDARTDPKAAMYLDSSVGLPRNHVAH